MSPYAQDVLQLNTEPNTTKELINKVLIPIASYSLNTLLYLTGYYNFYLF